jgi:hypothetical protein
MIFAGAKRLKKIEGLEGRAYQSLSIFTVPLALKFATYEKKLLHI